MYSSWQLWCERVNLHVIFMSLLSNYKTYTYTGTHFKQDNKLSLKKCRVCEVVRCLKKFLS